MNYRGRIKDVTGYVELHEEINKFLRLRAIIFGHAAGDSLHWGRQNYKATMLRDVTWNRPACILMLKWEVILEVSFVLRRWSVWSST